MTETVLLVMPGTRARTAPVSTPRMVAYDWRARRYPWAKRVLEAAEAVHGAPRPAGRPRKTAPAEAPCEAGVQDLPRPADGVVAVGVHDVLAASAGMPVRPGRLAQDRDDQPAAPSPRPVLPPRVDSPPPGGRCENCGYALTSIGHRTECGDVA